VRPRGDPEVDELALLLAATEEVRGAAAARIEVLARTCSPAQMVACFGGHGMLALLGTRLGQAVGDRLDPELGAPVQAALEHGRRRGAFYEHVTTELASLFEVDGIRVLPLKGVTLAKRVYGDLGMRQSNDIDLLVDPADLGRAIELLEPEGWVVRAGSVRAGRTPDLHRELIHRDGRRPSVDLHWRVHWAERRFSSDMLRRSRIAAGLREPEPSDELAALLLYYVRDGFTGLRYSSDAAALWDRHGGGMTAPLDAYLADHPSLSRLLELSAAVLEQVSGLPAAALITRPKRLSALDRRAMRLANWSRRGTRQQLQSNQALVDLLTSARPQLRPSVRRSFLLGGGRPTADSLLPAKRLGRFAYALWDVRMGRTWSSLPRLPLSGASSARAGGDPRGSSRASRSASRAGGCPSGPGTKG
jgi:hypothetical protein